MKKIISIAAGAALTTVLFLGVNHPAFAPADMFLKIDGIDGESTDSAHKGEIDVLSWSWGETSSTRATGERLMQPKIGASGSFTVVKAVDRASPKLASMHRSKTRIPSMTISVPPASGTGAYMKYELKNVLVTSYQTGGSADRPTEEVAFYYNKISYNESDTDFIKQRAKKK